MLQDTIFSESEGDAYFKRNENVYEQFSDPVPPFLAAQPINPSAILEIGASRGDRLAQLHERYHAGVTAVEPSAAAVSAGRKRYPAIQYFVASAKLLPLSDESYDLVITNGIFCWIDRRSLLASMSEIDRVLKPEGHLLIGDFAPFSPKKSRYHHRLDVELYTYKQDYSALFLATAGYVPITQQVLDYRSFQPAADIPERERYSVTLLRKVAGGIYSQQEP
jgi:SAM-dependent methyltransferase